MKIKKYILLFVVFALCLGMCVIPCSVSGAQKMSAEALVGLGIIPADADTTQREITRAEAVRFVMGMLISSPEKRQTVFQDVDAEHEYSGYIAEATDLGVISKGEMFRPSDKVSGNEFVKMLSEAAGLKNMAVSYGGYPQGYVFAAEQMGLLDGVVFGAENPVMFNDATVLISNALNMPVVTETVFEANDGSLKFAYENNGKNETFMQSKMGIKILKVFVDDLSAKEKKADITFISEQGAKNTSEFIKNNKYTFIYSENAEIADTAHTYAKLWLNRVNEIVFCECENNTEIKYAYIDKVNEVHKNGALSEVRAIKNITFAGDEDYTEIAEDCRFYFEGKLIEAGSVPYTDAFSRIVVYKNEVISVEGFKMQEGGIITGIDNGLLTYKNGRWNDKKYDSHATSDEVKVILNGESTSYWGIVEGMLFDYCEYNGRVLLVVSSVTVTDNFDGISGGSLMLGGELYKKSETFGVSFSRDGISYIEKVSENELLSELVTAYLDLSGKIRYMTIPLFDEESAEFYGFILGYNEDEFAEKAEFKVFRVYEDRVEEKILSMTKAVKNSEEFDDAVTAVSNLKAGELSSSLKDENNIVWKIRAVNGKIVSLKKAERFDQCPKDGITSVISIPGGTTPYIVSPRIYFDKAVICALFYDDYLGKVTAKILTPADIRDKTFSGVRMDFYNKPETSEIELALFRGDVKTIATNRADLINIGIMKFMNYTAGKEGNSAANVKILNEGTFTVPASKVSSAGKYSIIKYAENVVIPDESPINIVEVMADLSSNPYGWNANETSTSSTAPDGFYTDIVTKCDGRRVFFETLKDEEDDDSNVRYYVNVTTDYYVYRLTDNPENRFEEVTINEVLPGMRVWYGLRNQHISFMIIE